MSWSSANTSRADSDLLYRIARVVVHAVSVFEDAAYALQWLKQPNEALGGEAPFESAGHVAIDACQICSALGDLQVEGSAYRGRVMPPAGSRMNNPLRFQTIGTLALLIALLTAGCGGGDGGGVGRPPRPGSLQFEAVNPAVDENAGTATFRITRTGGSDGTVSVTVSSRDGSATATQDYTTVSTTVTFAAGDVAAKTVAVPIADDDAVEADETLTLVLSASSGGASLGPDATLTIRDNEPLAAPALTVGATIKQLTFRWVRVAGATSYRLLRNPDGASGFTQVGTDYAADATSATLELAVHRHDWLNARYRLEICIGQRCSASDEISALSVMLEAIGYFKASNSDMQDSFGAATAISSDGNTLAVSATTERSNATGVNGDQSDNSFGLAGAVYVFTRVGAQWSQQAYVKASNTERVDSFGFSLALSADGNTLAVGAPFEPSNATGVDSSGGPTPATDNDGAQFAGAVYVFARNGTDWSQQAYVKASNTGASDRFGDSVALSADGNTLAVGASGEASSTMGVGSGDPNEDNEAAPFSGAVYVFTRANTQWTQQAFVKASNTQENDGFGLSVALSADGSTLAVGAPNEDSRGSGVDADQFFLGENNSGAVYVFARTSMQWAQQTYIKASNSDPLYRFGTSLALSADGNTLAAGSPAEASNATGIDGNQANDLLIEAGAVYVLTRTGTRSAYQAYVKASNTDHFDSFGTSVALSADGNTLAVGAPREGSDRKGVDRSGGPTPDTENNAIFGAGAVYAFTRTAAQWSQHAYLKASNTRLLASETFSNDEFGTSVALSADGETLAVGAIGEDSNADAVGGDQADVDAPRAGAVYIF